MKRSMKLKDFNYFLDKSLIIAITTIIEVMMTTFATKVMVIFNMAFMY